MDVASDTVRSAGGPEGLTVEPLPPARAPWASKIAGEGDGGGAAGAAAGAQQGAFGYKEDDFVWAWGNGMDNELEDIFGDDGAAGSPEGGVGKRKGGGGDGKPPAQVRACLGGGVFGGGGCWERCEVWFWRSGCDAANWQVPPTNTRIVLPQPAPTNPTPQPHRPPQSAGG